MLAIQKVVTGTGLPKKFMDGMPTSSASGCFGAQVFGSAPESADGLYKLISECLAGPALVLLMQKGLLQCDIDPA